MFSELPAFFVFIVLPAFFPPIPQKVNFKNEEMFMRKKTIEKTDALNKSPIGQTSYLHSQIQSPVVRENPLFTGYFLEQTSGSTIFPPNCPNRLLCHLSSLKITRRKEGLEGTGKGELAVQLTFLF